MVTTRGWCGEEKEELFFSEYRIHIWEDKKFWRWMVVTVLPQYELLSATKCTQKLLNCYICIIYFITIKFLS